VRGTWVTRAGLLLVVAGLVVLGYVAWQLYGTTYVAKRDQERTVERTIQAWSTPVTIEKSSGPVPKGEATALVRIPAFGEKYVVPVFAGTSDEVLARGYGHFDHAAGPGEVGNYALAAHRITHGEPLRRMPELQPGDEVIIETRTRTYTYRLDTDPNELVVDFTQGWVVDPLPTNPGVSGGVQPPQRPGQRLITLTTCAELFHTDDRMIAFGHLVDSAARS
jgi:sortase A